LHGEQWKTDLQTYREDKRKSHGGFDSIEKIVQASPTEKKIKLDQEELLIKITERYTISKGDDCIVIRGKTSSEILARHEADGSIKSTSVAGNKFLYNTRGGTLFMIDLLDVAKPPLLLQKSEGRWTNFASTSDHKLSLVADSKNLLTAIDNASA
jgi:hypothetical protein